MAYCCTQYWSRSNVGSSNIIKGGARKAMGKQMEKIRPCKYKDEV
jgi:hypothetical protein